MGEQLKAKWGTLTVWLTSGNLTLILLLGMLGYLVFVQGEKFIATTTAEHHRSNELNTKEHVATHQAVIQLANTITQMNRLTGYLLLSPDEQKTVRRAEELRLEVWRATQAGDIVDLRALEQK